MSMNTVDYPEVKTGRKRLLSIDDDPSISHLLAQLLGERGYDVVSAENGLEGLKKANEMKPDLIVLDISMPEMDGWLVLKALKNNKELLNIPVVILSVFDEKKLGLELGATEYLLKPFDIEEIYTMIDRVEMEYSKVGTEDE